MICVGGSLDLEFTFANFSGLHILTFQNNLDIPHECWGIMKSRGQPSFLSAIILFFLNPSGVVFMIIVTWLQIKAKLQEGKQYPRMPHHGP
jgi:hypothetical protein